MGDPHSPLYLRGSSANDTVVFIHGFMGSPRQFDSLADAVFRQGCSAAALLLPGHGGTAKDFASGTFENWQSHVDSEVGRVSREYENVWLVGHSMGGLLALNAAVKIAGNVRGVFLIASPFKISAFSLYAIKVRIKQVFSTKSNPIRIAYLSVSSVKPSPSLIWHYAGPAAELKKLMSAARDNLPNVLAPVTAAYSSSDELTSPDSLEILKAELSVVAFEQVLLSDSLHAYYPEHERALLEKALLKMVLQEGG